MSEFQVYQHMEESVKAIQLSKDTQDAISNTLTKELKGRLLVAFQALYNSRQQCYEFVFRYKTDTQNKFLNITDYLIELNTGAYIVKTEKEFLQYYAATEQDPVLPQQQQQTFMQAYNSLSEEGTALWYNAEQDVLSIHLEDQGIHKAEGFADLLQRLELRQEVTSTTKFHVYLGNSSLDKFNLFSPIECELLVAELKRTPEITRNRLEALHFTKLTEEGLSAISTSVTTQKYDAVVNSLILFSGILTSSHVTR